MQNKYQYEFYRIIFVSSLGTIVEWAEYAFYGYMAIHISTLFFPEQDSRTGLLAAFGLFAAGFIMRPLGAILFSHIADVKGRKKALLYSMVVMGLSTFSIGMLPTYHVVGLLAPMLLLCCRLMQGLAIATEACSASIFLIEHHEKHRPYLSGSWPGMASALGIVIGGLAGILTAQSHAAWAWRIPFLVGGISCFIGLYLRQKIAESPLFMEAKNADRLEKIPFFVFFKGHSLAIVKTATMAIFVASIVYICNLYFATYLIQNGKFSSSHALTITTLGECMVVLFYPLCAMAADKWSGEHLIKKGLIIFIFLAPLIFILGKTGDFLLALLGQMIYAFFNALITAPMFKWLYDQFPLSIRATGINVSWNISVALLGGTAPLIAQYLVSQLHWSYGPGFYVSFCAIVILSVMNIKKTPVRGFALEQSAPPSVSFPIAIKQTH